jgi:copper chaperone NosL
MPERPWRAAVLGVVVLASCGGGARPVPIETGTPCSFCRMTIADPRLAAEIVAAGEEPRQYDDIGCLVNDLRKRPAPDGVAFVSDYRSGTLVPAATAVYTRVDAIATPMASHLVAHADAAARDADPRVRGGVHQGAADLFAPGDLHDR